MKNTVTTLREENGGKLREALETLISSLSMELHVFEHMRFHLSVGHAVHAVPELARCMEEAKLAMGQRLLIRNNLFLEEVPDLRKTPFTRRSARLRASVWICRSRNRWKRLFPAFTPPPSLSG